MFLVTSKQISSKTLNAWLDEFSKAVKKKTYNRINYNIWRDIQKWTKEDKIYIGLYGHYEEYDLYTTDETYNQLNLDFWYFSNMKPDGLAFSDKSYQLNLDNDFAKFLATKISIPDWNKTATWKSEYMSNNYDINTIKTTVEEYVKNKEEKTYEYKSNTDVPTYAVKGNDVANSYLTYSTNTNDLYLKSDGAGNWSTATVSTVSEQIGNLQDQISSINTAMRSFSNIVKNATNNKETDKTMNTANVFNFDFGPVTGSNIRMSMYGYAIPNKAGKYVSYDADTDRMMDVQILNFNCEGLFYKVPKALGKIEIGDVVFHNGIPVFVEDVEDNRLTVIDPQDGTEKTIMPAQSPFGFDYVTTLVSLVDGFCGECDPDEDNPFGNMLPFLFMSNGDMKNNLLPLMLMGEGKMDFSNPLMLLALSSDGKMDMNNPLMIMAMMKGFNK
jgi:hypothetical protein